MRRITSPKRQPTSYLGWRTAVLPVDSFDGYGPDPDRTSRWRKNLRPFGGKMRTQLFVHLEHAYRLLAENLLQLVVAVYLATILRTCKSFLLM